MKKYFVYYADDYYDNGGVGLETFDTKADALAFIERRLRLNEEPSLDRYTLIEGEQLELRPVETVTKLTAEARQMESVR
jgi:hypothetical protein